jgi:hypothetical protein
MGISASQIKVQDIDHLGIVAGIIDEMGLVEEINQLLGTHIPQVRSQNAVFLKHGYFSITNQSTRYRSLGHSGRDY